MADGTLTLLTQNTRGRNHDCWGREASLSLLQGRDGGAVFVGVVGVGADGARGSGGTPCIRVHALIHLRC